jgi:hypothetical protein
MSDEDFKFCWDLITKAKDYQMSPEERKRQLISFAYGNVKLSNPNVTVEMVQKAVEELYCG